MQSNATIQQLTAVLDKLTPRDQEFALSMLRSARKYGSFTPGQLPYVGQLIERATAPRPSVDTRTVGSFTAVIDLFKRAGQRLKWPKVRLLLADVPVILSVAGPQSKAPGTINVTGEGQYPNRTWYGRVDPSGAWEPARNINPATIEALGQLLSDFGKDPDSVAAAYGRATNQCCFCARELTDARSVAAGYGPVCAGHYGLTAQWEAAAGTSTDQTTATADAPQASLFAMTEAN